MPSNFFADYILGRPILSTRNPIVDGWPIPMGYAGCRYIIDQIDFATHKAKATAYKFLADIPEKSFDFQSLIIANAEWVGENE